MSRRSGAATEGQQHLRAHIDLPISGQARQAELITRLLRQLHCCRHHLADCQRASLLQRSEAQAASQRVLQLEGQLASSQREGEQLQHQGRAADSAAQRDRALAERSRLLSEVPGLQQRTAEAQRRLREAVDDGERRRAEHLRSVVRGLEGENTQLRLRADGAASSPAPSVSLADARQRAEHLRACCVALLHAPGWLLRSLGCPLAAALCGLLAVVALLALGRCGDHGLAGCLFGAEGTVHTALQGGSLALAVVLLSEVSLVAGVSVALLALAALPRLFWNAGRAAPPSLLVGSGSTARVL
eukprot:m51a1_g13154 hypothetical protein (301) ;mRNA; r:25634-26890